MEIDGPQRHSYTFHMAFVLLSSVLPGLNTHHTPFCTSQDSPPQYHVEGLVRYTPRPTPNPFLVIVIPKNTSAGGEIQPAPQT